ncbi:glycosyltransferase [Halopseudomonas sp.]|uniref:glycosyltransferase n=1 Tax=Halopseudomonas sp. TaxID=2901191 RepID=UPI0030023DA5
MAIASIIIPTYNDNEQLEKCIQALQQQDLPRDEYEIILVNNNPGNPLPQLSDNVVVLDEPIPGSYAARNKGLQKAKGDYIFFTDSDCIPSSDWISSALSFFSNQKVDRIAGHVSLFYSSSPPSIYEKLDYVTAFNQKTNAKNGVSVTANLIVRRTIFDQVGNFNAKLLSGGDIEWNKRATKAGYSIIYNPTSVVRHPARGSLQELKTKMRRVAGGKVSSGNLKLLRAIKISLSSWDNICSISKSKELDLADKIKCVLIVQLLKCYGTMCALLILLKLSSPQRK